MHKYQHVYSQIFSLCPHFKDKSPKEAEVLCQPVWATVLWLCKLLTLLAQIYNFEMRVYV